MLKRLVERGNAENIDADGTSALPPQQNQSKKISRFAKFQDSIALPGTVSEVDRYRMYRLPDVEDGNTKRNYFSSISLT